MKNGSEQLNENAPELEIEGVVRERFFAAFDCTRKVGNIDFCADIRCKSDIDRQSVVWAERKRGQDCLDDALVQLILTIGRARTFEQELPPPFLAAFNAVKIAFIPYESVMEVFSANDFNWNVAPSDHTTREFSELRTRVSAVLASEERVFDFRRDTRELRRFIANLRRKPGARIQITKTNFTHIFYKWREDVKPTIDMIDWKKAKKLTRSSEINVFGLAKDFGRLFAASTRAWSETTADIPEHREHRNVVAYHHYIVRISWEGKELLVRFTIREGACGSGNNEVHGTTVSSICVYKADGASMSDPSRSQGEVLAPFVDNKIALFLSAVNGGKIVLSEAARKVLEAGRELWRYYHALPEADPNASYYDIRRRFQGVDAKGRMNATSGDEKYGMILETLKKAMKTLAQEIRPKVYDYGFLKKED